jgi:uncharacterized membrane protein
MVFHVILLLTFLISPILIILLTERNRIASKIGSILIAYGLGLVIGNIGLIPEMSQSLRDYLKFNEGVKLSGILELFSQGEIEETDIMAFRIHKMQNTLLTISIPVALPLLLFSLNIRLWLRMAGKTITSMFLALFAVLLVVCALVVIYREKIEDINKIAGMLVGLYTGGTPNLAALKMMLNVDAETYLKVHTYDMIPSLAYLLFLVSFGKFIFRRILAPYPMPKNEAVYSQLIFEENAYAGFLKKKTLVPLLKALLLSVLIFALAGSLTLIVPQNVQMLSVILTITTLSILASVIPRVNQIEKTFELGMYFILLFSVVVASMANVRSLTDISVPLLMLISLVIFGSLFIHTLLAKIFRVNADILMVTSTALICSPPFVPMVAGALNNKEIVVSGLTVGIMGYAIGNYLGVMVSWVFQLFLP